MIDPDTRRFVEQSIRDYDSRIKAELATSSDFISALESELNKLDGSSSSLATQIATINETLVDHKAILDDHEARITALETP